MIIGTFRAAEDGYIGRIRTLSFDCVGVAVVPAKKAGTFSVVLVGRDDTANVELGTAWRRRGKSGGHLEFKLDCPGLVFAFVARMSEMPNRDGVCELKWKR